MSEISLFQNIIEINYCVSNLSLGLMSEIISSIKILQVLINALFLWNLELQGFMPSILNYD
jgi:hypothetical protein